MNIEKIISLLQKYSTELSDSNYPLDEEQLEDQREIKESLEELENFDKGLIFRDVPVMTPDEQFDMRVYLALSHEDGGKCRIYGDDGELQCNNIMRHGRFIDFRREPIKDLLAIVQETRLKEFYEQMKANPKDFVSWMESGCK
jgi:hypothetical protein